MKTFVGWVAVSLMASTLVLGDVPIGARIDAFELRDFRGKVHKLSDSAGAKGVVVAFLGTECPLANLYAPVLEQLAAEYSAKGITFLGVNSNIQDTLAEVGAFARRHNLTFPLLKDADGALADRLGATRTPEVVLLDANGKICYRGRVDDKFGIGYQKKDANRRDLVEAIEEMLADKVVSQPLVAATGCFIGREPKVDPHGDVTYSNQISRLFNSRCVECHRAGELAPFPMTSYDEVVGWIDTIREVVQEERMPPWFANPEYGQFKNDCRLTDEQKSLVYKWIDNGAPEGDKSQLPDPPSFPDGWLISKPDEIIYISDEPVDVPADGVVEYRYYSVDPGWTEDKWISASECRPGNRAVVHHIIAFIESPNAGGGFAGRGRSGLGGYAPGMPPVSYEDGTALFVPAGAKIVFQMHYTSNGAPQTDRSCVGVRFVDGATVKQVAKGGLAPNLLFRIPPGAENHKVTSQYVFKRDTTLRSLTPHMHLRGKSFRFEAEYPDGTKEILLDVPRYDFNWQLRYELAEPKKIPKGTKLLCTAHFDNSANNLNNPDPTAAVRWGDQTWEEMMIGWFSTVNDVDPKQRAGETES